MAPRAMLPCRWVLAGTVAAALLWARPIVHAGTGAADGLLLAVNGVRIGVHAGFTRVVIDLTGPAEWSTDLDASGTVRILIPGARVLPAGTLLEPPRGLVRSARVLERPSGVEVALDCRGPVDVGHLALGDPDRLVLDLRPALARATPPRGGGGPPGAAGRSPAPTAPSARVRSPQRSERPLTIVLDPGHGGHDTGAVGPLGLLEKDVVLDVALRLAELLRTRLAVRVLLTRAEDVFVPLGERTTMANRARADFLLSLHVNGAGRRRAAGFETFFFSREPSDSDARASAQRENLPLEAAAAGDRGQEELLRATLADMAVTRDMKESASLAEAILGALDGLLAVQNRGVKSGPFHVLATAAMPAVLVESAFITNPEEERQLRQDAHRQRIAEALFAGIARYKARYEQRLGMGAPAPEAGS